MVCFRPGGPSQHGSVGVHGSGPRLEGLPPTLFNVLVLVTLSKFALGPFVFLTKWVSSVLSQAQDHDELILTKTNGLPLLPLPFLPPGGYAGHGVVGPL